MIPEFWATVVWCLGFGHVVSQHIMLGMEGEESVLQRVSKKQRARGRDWVQNFSFQGNLVSLVV